jgi:uncharacterized protein (TIGR03067 family)
MRNLRVVSVALGLLGLSSVLAQDDKGLEDSWIIVSGQAQGKEVPAKEFQDGEVIFADGKMTAKKGGKTFNVFTYKLNVKTKPASIDFAGIDGAEKGKKQSAIYEITGQEMKLCISVDGKDRPTTFWTEEGRDWLLLVLKRKK